MADVRWTITGEDAFKAKAYVWDGPVLARGERVLVAPAAALERAEERLRTLEEASREVVDAASGYTAKGGSIWKLDHALDALRAVLSSQEPSTDQEEER